MLDREADTFVSALGALWLVDALDEDFPGGTVLALSLKIRKVLK